VWDRVVALDEDALASALRVAECLVTPLELGLLDLEQRGVGALNGGAGAPPAGISRPFACHLELVGCSRYSNQIELR